MTSQVNYMTGGKSGKCQNDVMWRHMTSRRQISTKNSGYVLYTNILLACKYEVNWTTLGLILTVSLFFAFIWEMNEDCKNKNYIHHLITPIASNQCSFLKLAVWANFLEKVLTQEK